MKAYREQFVVDLHFVERCSLKGVIYSSDPINDNKSKTMAELIPQ